MKIKKLLESTQTPNPGIHRLLDFIDKKFDYAVTQSNDTHSKNQACLYLSYLMCIRDFDHHVNAEDEEVVPKKYLHSQPDIRSAMRLVKTFAKKCEKDRTVNKRVNDHYSKFINGDHRIFKHNVEKLRKYFNRATTLQENSSDSVSHPLLWKGFSVAEIDFLRKLQNNRALQSKFLQDDECIDLANKLMRMYSVDSKKDALSMLQKEELLNI